jgi:hypothetical protein
MRMDGGPFARQVRGLVPLGLGALVCKTDLGPKRQRAGALHDASRLSGLVASAPASGSAVALHRCGPKLILPTMLPMRPADRQVRAPDLRNPRFPDKLVGCAPHAAFLGNFKRLKLDLFLAEDGGKVDSETDWKSWAHDYDHENDFCRRREGAARPGDSDKQRHVMRDSEFPL